MTENYDRRFLEELRSSPYPVALVVDHVDHFSETRYASRGKALAYILNGYTYDLLTSTGYTPEQLDALGPEEFRGLLAEGGFITQIIE